MNALRQIRVQKLFLLAVILKTASAFAGWYLQAPWSLGFWLPLLVMATYIALGLNRYDRDVTDEKFADSCYYLGFIFTITSIVFSLLDLPSIGERIQDIAVRFGAAMVSTVFGLAVRVYLVSFRPDSSDALKIAEDAVLEAAQKFREQLVMAYEKIGDFQGQVVLATQTSIESVKLQVEKLAEDHSARLERVFVELNERNQLAVTQALSEVGAASSRMSESVDEYANSMKVSLDSLGEKVDAFAEAATRRLKTTTFPDDYFASQLAAPLEQLKAAALQVSEQVQGAATGAGEAAVVLSGAIRKLKTKADQAEGALDTVVRLSTAQHAIFDSSAAQLEQLKKVGEILAEVERALQESKVAIADNATSNREVHGRVTAVVAAIESSQQAMIHALGQVSARLEADREAATSLERQVASSEVATKELANELRGNSAVAQQLTAMLEAEAGSVQRSAAEIEALELDRQSILKVLTSLDAKASVVSTVLAESAAHLRGVAERLDALDTRQLSSTAHVPATATATPLVSPAMPAQQSVAASWEAPLTVQPVPGRLTDLGSLTTSATYFSESSPNRPGGGPSGDGTRG